MTEIFPKQQKEPITPLVSQRTLGIVSHKIHYVHNGEYYTDGGFPDYVEGLAAHFGKTMLVVPVAKLKNIRNFRKVSYLNCEIHPLPGIVERTAAAWLMSPIIRRVVRRAVHKCDVVNVRMFSLSAMAALSAIENMNKPVFLSLVGQAYFGRTFDIRALLRRRMEKMIHHHLTFVHGWHLVDIHHLDPSMCEPTYSSTFHASDILDHAHSGPAKDESIRLIFVGRLDPYKGVDMVLKALAAQPEFKQQFHLDIVGDGEFRKPLMNLVQQLGLRKIVVFHGYLKHGEKMNRLMESAHAMVFVPLHEGAPKVVMEAMRFGLPIIASRVGAIPTVIQEGNNGWLVDPNKVEQIVAKLRVLSEMCPTAYVKMSKTNLELAKQYTIESVSRYMVQTLIDRGLIEEKYL